MSLLAICMASTVAAYDSSLDERAIEAAFALGQRNDRETAEFLDRYLEQRTEQAADGIHRADIEVLTPFVQILDRARDNSQGYTLEQAKADYRERGDTVVIRISIVLPANYPTATDPTASGCDNTALEPQNFWSNFAFVVKQRDKAVTARSVKNEPVYSAPSKDAPARLDGANVRLEFDAKNIVSEPLFVDIHTPLCKTISTRFDLASLR